MGNCEKHQMLYKLAKKYITICGSTSSSYHKLNADTKHAGILAPVLGEMVSISNYQTLEVVMDPGVKVF